jgi:cytochrome P450
VTPLAIEEMTKVTSYRDVGAVFNNADARQALHRSSDANEDIGPGPTDAFVGDSVISLHGDKHFNRRRLESKLFTKAARARMEFEIVLPAFRRAIAEQLADSPDGAVDLMAFTRLILVRLSGAVVGVPPIDDLRTAERLRQISEKILNAVAVDWSDDDKREETTRLGLEARDAFEREFYEPGRKCAHASGTSDNIMSLLVQTPGSVASEDVIFREAVLFLIASSNTTTNALSFAVRDLEGWLASNPEARAETSSFDFCRSVVTEALRLHPPVPGLWRQMLNDLTLPSGVELKTGDFVFLDLIASSRDPEVFGDDADEFNPRREVPKGSWPFAFTFGGGAHMCIGRTLAIGDAAPSDDASEPQGVLTRLLHEMYKAGLTLDPDKPPVSRQGTAKDEYVTFPVRFAQAPVA